MYLRIQSHIFVVVATFEICRIYGQDNLSTSPPPRKVGREKSENA